MKKNVLVFGLISGTLVTAMMLGSIYLAYNKEDFEGNMVLGFAMMIAALSFVFVGVRNYRNKYNDGYITFWQALKVGLGIALIASTIYVVTWMIFYYTVVPDWMEVYAAYEMRLAEKAGASAEQLAVKAGEMAWYKEQYKSPFGIIWLTYTEILVVALPVTLLSAAILAKRRKV